MDDELRISINTAPPPPIVVRKGSLRRNIVGVVDGSDAPLLKRDRLPSLDIGMLQDDSPRRRSRCWNGRAVFDIGASAFVTLTSLVLRLTVNNRYVKAASSFFLGGGFQCLVDAVGTRSSGLKLHEVHQITRAPISPLSPSMLFFLNNILFDDTSSKTLQEIPVNLYVEAWGATTARHYRKVMEIGPRGILESEANTYQPGMAQPKDELPKLRNIFLGPYVSAFLRAVAIVGPIPLAVLSWGSPLVRLLLGLSSGYGLGILGKLINHYVDRRIAIIERKELPRSVIDREINRWERIRIYLLSGIALVTPFAFVPWEVDVPLEGLGMIFSGFQDAALENYLQNTPIKHAEVLIPHETDHQGPCTRRFWKIWKVGNTAVFMGQMTYFYTNQMVKYPNSTAAKVALTVFYTSAIGYTVLLHGVNFFWNREERMRREGPTSCWDWFKDRTIYADHLAFTFFGMPPPFVFFAVTNNYQMNNKALDAASFADKVAIISGYGALALSLAYEAFLATWERRGVDHAFKEWLNTITGAKIFSKIVFYKKLDL